MICLTRLQKVHILSSCICIPDALSFVNHHFAIVAMMLYATNVMDNIFDVVSRILLYYNL